MFAFSALKTSLFKAIPFSVTMIGVPLLSIGFVINCQDSEYIPACLLRNIRGILSSSSGSITPAGNLISYGPEIAFYIKITFSDQKTFSDRKTAMNGKILIRDRAS